MELKKRNCSIGMARLSAIKTIAIATLVCVIGTYAEASFAQGVVDRNHVPSTERIDSFERRSDNIDGNNIRATITNWAQTAQSNSPGDFFYEWPKNTGRIYIALTQLWVGAQIPQDGDDDLYVVDIADFRSNPVDENVSWTFEPIKGYVNPAGEDAGPGGDGIAQSDERASWPPFWPDKLSDSNDPGWAGSWNGFFGRDIFNADQEFFFKIGDDQYDRYTNFFPDSTDLTRKGMGIVADVRIMSWSQILIDDVVFIIHGVTNDGSYDLPRVSFSMWLADLVGGDASDDIPFFDLLEDVAFMTDEDGIGTEPFGSDPVGEAAFAFLETPGNAVDRIDNDADGSTADECTPFIGECNSPIVPEEFLVGENPTNGIDDNGNGLIDENTTHVPFVGGQAENVGVGYADYIDNDSDGEAGSPLVTSDMIAAASADAFLVWPPNPLSDAFQAGSVHLVGLDNDDLGLGFRDNIDNNNSADTPSSEYPYLTEPGSPTVTQEMVDAAASDPYRRYKVPGTSIILYAVGPEDLGLPYADGLDNDEDGAVDEGIDEGIDEMIDESRSDAIDNDRDWNPLQDDTGLDGVGFNGDTGDQDGMPTTGSGTSFPGERNIDVTDVSESDQIGITNVQIIPAFSLNFNSQSDRFLFLTYMVPGDFDEDIPEPGENDLVISSGLFPLQAGQTERISLSIQLGLTREEVLASRDNALDAYLQDYQFAQAPITPEVTAVPGDGRVTLYWDDLAEESFDDFLFGIGREPRDFEGYKVYRSTDPAFLDPRVITDGRGNLLFRKPIAEFDRIDEHEGFHPTDINGVKFYLGNNRRDKGEDASGLAHMFVDSTAINGIKYFYAVTAYDYGSAIDNIPPTETPIRIQRLPDGTIVTGPNVVEIEAAAPVAGYMDATLSNTNGLIPRTKGSTTSRIRYQIVDPRAVKDGHTYRVTFKDSLKLGSTTAPDTLTTQSFSLIDVTDSQTVINESTAFREGSTFPLFDDFGVPLGFALIFQSEPLVAVNSTLTCWNRDEICSGPTEIFPTTLDPYIAAGFVKGLRNPADYRIKIVGPGEGQSVGLQVRRTITLPARPTNVQVFRVTPDGTEIPVDYAFWDLTGDDFVSPTSTDPASFSVDPQLGESDLIIINETKVGDDGGDKIITWRIGLNFTVTNVRQPQAGDVADIVLRKPFLSTDEFEFTVSAPSAGKANPDSLLAQVTVVPNPYVATNRFEELNPFSSGRGPRVIKFIHLPPEAVVRIFTVGGRQVRELRLNEGVNDGLSPEALLNGTLDWDLQSEDGLSVSYGVYLYHVDAPGLGETTGTFAIIK